VESLSAVRRAMRSHGVVEVLVKRLAQNDNSKNQIYVGDDLSSLGKLPSREVTLHAGTSRKHEPSKRGPIFRAALDFAWLDLRARVFPAPNAKLIVYPQYPEVRLSGFLAGCPEAPSELFDPTKRGRERGRVLLLGFTNDRRIIAAAYSADHPAAREISLLEGEKYGALEILPDGVAPKVGGEPLLLGELLRIHRLGWIRSKRLTTAGEVDCRGTNCGGYTLEAELGIIANGFSEPDYHGWEVKQHNVGDLLQPRSSRVTLFTPEPTGGVYVEEGPEAFVRRWGYPDKRGRPDRLNFGGVYRCGELPHPLTSLRLRLIGFDSTSGQFDGGGKVALVDDTDAIAAEWSFAKLMDHWKRKHDKAAYIPSVAENDPVNRYRYGKDVLLAEGAFFVRLLRAFDAGSVFYDPGIKLENAEGPRPALKRRSQFRIASGGLQGLYDSTRKIDVSSP
jgi:hypothetical protein